MFMLNELEWHNSRSSSVKLQTLPYSTMTWHLIAYQSCLWNRSGKWDSCLCIRPTSYGFGPVHVLSYNFELEYRPLFLVLSTSGFVCISDGKHAQALFCSQSKATMASKWFIRLFEHTNHSQALLLSTGASIEFWLTCWTPCGPTCKLIEGAVFSVSWSNKS